MIDRASLHPRRLKESQAMSAFQHRNYRLFFGGQAISLVGTWMQQVAQAWLVLELTHDPIWLGIVSAAQFIPVIILGLFAGVAADALPKRRVLIATQIAMMVLAAILAVLVFTDVVEVWMILVLAFLLGIANAVDMPVRQAFSIELVGREDIGNAVALNSAMFNGARVVGPALAGLAIAAFGVGPAFAINAVSFLAVIIGLRLMDDEALHVPNRIARPDSARAVVRNLKEGLRYVRGTPIVLLAVTTVGVVATVGMNFNVLIPAFAQNDLQSGAAGYGFLMAASGVGSLLAAVRLVIGGRPRAVRLATGALILGVASLALAVTREFPVALVLMVFDRVRVDPDGGDRQHDDPARGPGPPPWPGDERLHDGVQRLGPDRRPGDGGCRLRRSAPRSRSPSAASCRCSPVSGRGRGAGRVRSIRSADPLHRTRPAGWSRAAPTRAERRGRPSGRRPRRRAPR